MTIQEYKEAVWKLFREDIKNDPDKALLYLTSKLVNEVTEIWGISLEYAVTDEDNMESIAKADALAVAKSKDEAGDVFWYIANLSTLLNLDIVEQGEPAQFGSIASMIQLTTYSGELLGYVLKKQFHNKEYSQEVFANKFNQVVKAFMGFIKDPDMDFSLEEIMNSNLEKLFNRHQGQQYNDKVYSTPQVG